MRFKTDDNKISSDAGVLALTGSTTQSESGGVVTVTVAGSGGTSLAPTAVKTGNYTASASDLVPCDTTSAGFTVTLPTAPADKAQVAVKHVIQGGINLVTVAAAGSDVFNKASGVTTLTLSVANQGVLLQYKATGAIWYVVGEDPLAPPAPAMVMSPGSISTNQAVNANQATWSRVYVPVAIAVTNVNIYIQTSSGNIDVGIYSDSAGLPTTRLWSRGSVASPGTGQRSIAISAGSPAALVLPPGTYWLGGSADNGTFAVMTVGGSAGVNWPLGVLANQSTAFPLPSTAAAAVSNGNAWMTTLT